MVGTIGEIRMFGGNFAPTGWAFCNGQIMLVADNTALFSILGTTYGGNGTTTFVLPDLRGRVPVGQGQGPGLSDYDLGQLAGSEGSNITGNNLPSHNHTLSGTIKMLTTNTPGDSETPGGNYFANDGSAKHNTSNTGATMKPANLSGFAVGSAGNGTPVNNMVPFLAMNYVICLDGIFPSRN